MDSELKKCPFCGGVVDVDMGTIGGIFKCQECSAKVYIFQDTEKDTIAAWNHRADHIHQSVKMVEFTKDELKAIGSLIFRAYPNGGKMNDIESSILAKCEAAMKGVDDERR